MVLCKNKDDADYMRSLRAHGWVRDLPADSHLYKKTGDAFNDNFIFATPGYNVRPLEMSGAIGSVQLKKWPAIMKTRTENAQRFVELFGNKSWCRIQRIIGDSSWFTFGMVLDGELKGRRADIIKALDEPPKYIEGLANHRGSAFGRTNTIQDSCANFENTLFIRDSACVAARALCRPVYRRPVCRRPPHAPPPLPVLELVSRCPARQA